MLRLWRSRKLVSSVYHCLFICRESLSITPTGPAAPSTVLPSLSSSSSTLQVKGVKDYSHHLVPSVQFSNSSGGGSRPESFHTNRPLPAVPGAPEPVYEELPDAAAAPSGSEARPSSLHLQEHSCFRTHTFSKPGSFFEHHFVFLDYND